MRFLNRLERRFGHLAIPNLTLVIVIGQVTAFIGSATGRPLTDQMIFTWPLFRDGEYWRIFSYLFVPFHSSPLWFLIAMNVLYLLGSVLEQSFGTFKFNLYLLVGWLASLGIAIAYPGLPASNGFLETTIFLAFAWLRPDFVFNLMFLLPVKVKWLALLLWAQIAFALYEGPNAMRLYALAGVANFLLFFGQDLLRAGREKVRLTQHKVKHRAHRQDHSTIHRCVICGVTPDSRPEMEFRYCSKCDGTVCYCMDHLQNHEHLVAPDSQSRAK